MNKNRGLLLDRDGVINVDHNFVGTVARFEFMPGLFTFLRAAIDLGYRLAVLTNQSGVARGHYTAQDHDQVTAHMVAQLKREKIDIDLALVCFEHPEGAVPAYSRESFWRKPNPGMVLEAIRRLDLDPARSAFLGDRLRDVQAGQSGGVSKNFWLTQENVTAPAGVQLVRNYDDALKALR